MKLEKEEFIRRLLIHFPNRREITVRRYGLYSNYRSDKLRRIKREFEDNENIAQERKPLKALDYMKENELFDKNCKCPYCKTELFLKGRYKRDEILKIKIFPIEKIQKENQYHKKKA